MPRKKKVEKKVEVFVNDEIVKEPETIKLEDVPELEIIEDVPETPETPTIIETGNVLNGKREFKDTIKGITYYE